MLYIETSFRGCLFFYSIASHISIKLASITLSPGSRRNLDSFVCDGIYDYTLDFS